MKKLWKRFKNWLIYKLGGYVERTCVVRHHTVTPITLFSTINGVDVGAYHDDEVYRKHADQAVIHELAEYMYANREQIIDIQESVPDFSNGRYPTMSIKAIVKVCPKPTIIEPTVVTFDKSQETKQCEPKE